MHDQPTKKTHYGVCKFCQVLVRRRTWDRCRSCFNKQRIKYPQIRFFNKFRVSDGCWLWRGAINTDGYGKIWINGLSISAHRFSWEIYRGPIPEGMQVLHECDIRNCVNPSHLWLGTEIENALDMKEKGRHPRGETHGNAKLTYKKVRKIRKLYASGKYRQWQIGKMFGIIQAHVSSIVHKKSWVIDSKACKEAYRM